MTDPAAPPADPNSPAPPANPNPPPAPTTYLDKPFVQYSLKIVERSPEPHVSHYRHVMVSILNAFFPDKEYFDVFQGASRGERGKAESRVDIMVLKTTCPPGGSLLIFDYCLGQSKAPGADWEATRNDLSRHCADTDNPSGQVYGIVHIGLEVQLFSAIRGVLTPLSDVLHLRRDVDLVTTLFTRMKTRPFPFVSCDGLDINTGWRSPER
jgi:hypothetical protein